MANGAGRIFDILKNTSKAATQSSYFTTVTVSALNPLTLILDDRIVLTEDFIQLAADIDKSKLTIGTKLDAIALNNGQLYYIQPRKDINKDDTDTSDTLNRLSTSIATLESRVAILEEQLSSLTSRVETLENN